jgi:excisionase family DNA binding protein
VPKQMQHMAFRDYDYGGGRLVGAREAARLTGLHTATLYRWARERRLRRFRVFGCAVQQFARAELAALIQR